MMTVITKEEKIKAIRAIASIDKIKIDPHILVVDINILAEVYSESETFQKAVSQLCHHLYLLVIGKVDTSDLGYNLKEWDSCHFQSKREKGQKADMRIIYRKENDYIIVAGFGNRFIPTEIYKRIANRMKE
ncbi:MAG: hypothetical protein KBT36_14420 [Kurthia sp.]|nr:hypothetical protein [Candidatus Kurthia equi]